jgi:peptidyl-prolyl cis-trans isomerase D
MLDVMRRKKGLLKFILIPVVVGVAGTFVFAIYGIWGGGTASVQDGTPNWIAVVDGEQIPTGPFQQRRASLLQDYREQFGGQGLEERQLTALAEQQALGSLLALYLARQEATRAGIQVTDEEIRDAIVNLPIFQQEGRFVGLKRYQDFLRAQGLEAAEFEADVAQELAENKLRLSIYSLAHVSDAQIEKRFRDEVERVDVDYVLLADADYADSATPSEAELRKHFEEHAEEYMTPESRRASYVLFDREMRAATTEVSEDQLRASYESNKATLYSHGDQRRASHILLRLPAEGGTEGDEALRARAEDLLARIRAGEDFADLARQHSEDSSSAPAGGDLGYFERGRMVPEFEDAAFSQPVGEVSEAFKTAFGFHIVKTTGSRPAGSQAFEEVREEIRRGLTVQKAQEEIRSAADDFTSRLAAQESSLAGIAGELGYEVAETGFFGRGEPVAVLGRLPQVDDAVFSLQTGDHTPPVAVPSGLAVFKLEEVRPPQPAPMESVRSRVETDFKDSRAREKARKVADGMLAAKGNLKDRAGARELEVRNYPAVNRVQPLPPLTVASKAAAFAGSVGSVLGPYESDDGLVVIEVKGKSPASPGQEAIEREDLRRRLMEEERRVMYQTVLARLESTAKIQVNEGLLTPR